MPKCNTYFDQLVTTMGSLYYFELKFKVFVSVSTNAKGIGRIS